MPTDNKSLVRRLYDEVWNMRKLAVIRELISPSHAAQVTDATDPGIGPEAYTRKVIELVTAFPDLKFTLLDMIAEDDKVVVYWNISGTHQGEFRGIAPTGKTISVDGITIHQLANGKVMDSYVSWDMWGLMQQLGAVPAVGQPQKASAR